MPNIEPRRNAIEAARQAFERLQHDGKVARDMPFHCRIEASGDPDLPEQVVVLGQDNHALPEINPVKFCPTIGDYGNASV